MSQQAPPVANPDSNEWYSPVDVVEAARRTMGTIDLDPFSCPQANEVVQAGTYYAKEPKHRSAFANPWAGNVWMNPPYSRGLIDKAVGRFLQFLDAGEIPFAITLTPLSDAAWYHELLDDAVALCLLRGRLRHWGPLAKNTQGDAGKRPQCIMYFERVPMPFDLGIKQFSRDFSGFGKVLKL